MWSKNVLVCRSYTSLRCMSSTTTPSINPKDYLKSWLGSDLGNEVPAMHSTNFPGKVSQAPGGGVNTPAPANSAVDTSLKRLSLISLHVDWSENISSNISKISPTGGDRRLSCFLNMKDCSYSASHVEQLMNAYEKSGYEIIATNVPSSLQDMCQKNGISFIMSNPTNSLRLHPVPSTQVQVTSTQINIPTTKDKTNSTEESSIENKLQVGTVRSGQQVYAEDCSLTVMGTVNEGGEIMSDGDIYVFGKLRGRAVAGLGAKDAANCRIYVSQFEASLIGIKSVFCIPEDHRVEYQMLKGRDVCITLEAKNPNDGEKVVHVHGQGLAAAPICVIDCDDDYNMAFRPFLS